jgi:hypothetical protein
MSNISQILDIWAILFHHKHFRFVSAAQDVDACGEIGYVDL